MLRPSSPMPPRPVPFPLSSAYQTGTGPHFSPTLRSCSASSAGIEDGSYSLPACSSTNSATLCCAPVPTFTESDKNHVESRKAWHYRSQKSPFRAKLIALRYIKLGTIHHLEHKQWRCPFATFIMIENNGAILP
jgi:hypothetical protein